MQVRAALPERQHRHGVGIASHLVGEHSYALRSWPTLLVEPELAILEPVEQPGAECTFLLRVPWLCCPSPLVLRSLQQAYVRV